MTRNALKALDELDRHIVVALQRDGRASWTAIAEIVDSSAATVARRGQQLIADGIVRIAVNPVLGATGEVDSFFIRINCAPGTQIEVARQLVEHEDVRFVTIVTGRYDIIAELVVRGGAINYPQMITELQQIEGVERWRSDLVMHVYKVSFDWGRQLFAETMELDPPESFDNADANCGPEHFDEVDLAIVAALRDDGRETFQAVAATLGINESSVRRRFERLRASHCIDILTLVPAPALGMGAETLLTVKVKPSRLDDVARELSRHPAVRYLAATLDENVLFCEVITRSADELHKFISTVISTLDGVEGWTAAMELLFLKRGFIETPWWRSQVGIEA